MATSFVEPLSFLKDKKGTPQVGKLQPEKAADALSEIYKLWLEQTFDEGYRYLLPILEEYVQYFNNDITFEEMVDFESINV